MYFPNLYVYVQCSRFSQQSFPIMTIMSPLPQAMVIIVSVCLLYEYIIIIIILLLVYLGFFVCTHFVDSFSLFRSIECFVEQICLFVYSLKHNFYIIYIYYIYVAHLLFLLLILLHATQIDVNVARWLYVKAFHIVNQYSIVHYCLVVVAWSNFIDVCNDDKPASYVASIFDFVLNQMFCCCRWWWFNFFSLIYLLIS